MNAHRSISRLFIALWPDDAVRRNLLAWRDGWQWPTSASPVHADKLHVTLHFLGDVETARVAELTAALDVPFEPFTLHLGRNVLWPNKIAVLEPHGSPAGLLALQDKLGKVIDGLGLPRDARDYKPHVTLARRAGTAKVVQDGPDLLWQVNSFALLQSANGYQVLRHYAQPGPG